MELTSGEGPAGGPAQPRIKAGAVIGGRYLLREPIGKGGMGSVWRAEHLTIQRDVAVKFLDLPDGSDSMRDRFLREARASAAVRHRYIVDIIDFGATPGGRPYMVMELVKGRSLFQRREDGQPIPLAEATRITARLLSALEAVHGSGLVHADLKPENVLLLEEDGREDVPKLLDFGVARAFRRDPTSRIRSVLPSAMSVVVGTPQYMSPEQANGDSIDERSDLFAVGILLYEMLSGALPFDGDNPMKVLQLVRDAKPVPLENWRPDLHPNLLSVVERAMARDVEDRFQHAGDFRVALLGAVAAHARKSAGSATAADTISDSSPPLDDPSQLLEVAAENYDDGAPTLPPPQLPPPELQEAPAARSLSPGFWLGVSGVVLFGLVAAIWIVASSSSHVPPLAPPSSEELAPGTAATSIEGGTVESATVESGTVESGTVEPTAVESGTAEPPGAEPTAASSDGESTAAVGSSDGPEPETVPRALPAGGRRRTPVPETGAGSAGGSRASGGSGSGAHPGALLRDPGF